MFYLPASLTLLFPTSGGLQNSKLSDAPAKKNKNMVPARWAPTGYIYTLPETNIAHENSHLSW